MGKEEERVGDISSGGEALARIRAEEVLKNRGATAQIVRDSELERQKLAVEKKLNEAVGE